MSAISMLKKMSDEKQEWSGLWRPQHLYGDAVMGILLLFVEAAFLYEAFRVTKKENNAPSQYGIIGSTYYSVGTD